MLLQNMNNIHLNYIFKEKIMNENSFVNVSVCKCNIKSKPNTFYARVCKSGKVGSEELLLHLKKEAPYIDVNMMRAGLEKITEIVANLTASGKDVDFFNLGTFSLRCEGTIEVKPGMKSYVEDEGEINENADFDISEAVSKAPTFSLKFEPSASCKKAYKQVKMAFALKKRHAPLIEKVENATPASTSDMLSIIKVKGENLKIVGEKEEIGVYIQEENCQKIKVDKENIIQNTPGMLLILLNTKLKHNSSYTFSILTQYARMGSTSSTSKLRKGVTECIWKEKIKEDSVTIQDDNSKQRKKTETMDLQPDLTASNILKKKVKEERKLIKVFDIEKRKLEAIAA